MTDEQKQEIIRRIFEEVAIKDSARLGYHAEQVLGVSKFQVPPHILNSIESKIILDKRYKSEPYIKSSKDYVIFKDPDYKEATQREKEIDHLTYEKLKYDVKISKRVVKTYTWTQIIAWISFVVALFLGYLEIAEAFKLWPYRK